jgi:protein TonB
MSLRSPATDRSLFSGSLLISFALHLGLVALVLFGGGWPQPGPPPVLTVNLVAPGSAPGPGGPSASAGAPRPQAKSPGAPPAPKVQPAPPSPRIKKKPKKRRAQPLPKPRPLKALPDIPPRPTPPVVQAPTPPKSAALRPVSPSASAAPTAGSSRAGSGGSAGAGQAGAGAARSAVLGYGRGGQGGGQLTAQHHYLQLIRARILAQRQYPYMARQRRQQGVVRLRFTLCPAGTLSRGVEVVKPSGFALLDKQAQQCVLAAAPFPPFPFDLKRERLTVNLPIIYKISDLDR